MNQEKENKTMSNIPQNVSDFRGQFVVFFSEDEKPAVLFHSFVAEEAYEEAKKIHEKLGRNPIVIRIPENEKENIAQFLAVRYLK